MAERCPECNRPRPRGVLRCACNYTFEYAFPSRGRTRRSPQLEGVLVVLVLAAAIAGYVYVPHEPDRAGLGCLLLAAGVFSAVAAIANIAWFFASARARLMTMVLGRSGARVLYALIGGGLVGAGAQLLLAA